MKKIILILFIINSALLNAQINKSNTFDLEKKISSHLNFIEINKFFSHQSVSLGGGIVVLDTKSIFSVFSISTSIHFSEIYHLEIKYDYYNSAPSNSKHNLLSLIPQIGFNLNRNNLKLYTGLGLGITESSGSALAFPTGNLKIEYSLNRRYSVNTETVFWPPMQKLNFSYYLPY